MGDIDEPASPFQANSEQDKSFAMEREKTTWEKLSKLLIQYTQALFIYLLPSDEIKQMPPKYMYGFGTILIACVLGVFIALFTDGYITTRNQEFLAPLNNQVSADPNCKTIEVSNSGTYMATQSGIWQGQPGFIFSEATYLATITNFDMSFNQWEGVMDSLYGMLVDVGNITSTQNLGVNLLYWMSFTAEPEPSNAAQRFYLVGDPLVIFNRQEIIGTVSSITGVCNVSAVSDLDLSSGLLQTEYNYFSFIQDPICNTTIDPMQLGYLSGFNADLFEFAVDVRSIITCISVNQNILFFDQLIPIQQFNSMLVYDGEIYFSSSYYNAKYPGMNPLVCLDSATVQQCIIRVTPLLYALPIFFHLGNSTEVPQQCDCAYMSEADKLNSYNLCNQFNFIMGYIFYDTPEPFPFFGLAKKFNYNFTALNNAAFKAAFAASAWGRTSPYKNEFDSAAFREEAYDFCLVDGQYCRLMVFSLFDQYQYNWAISSYYYQLNYGACQDRISLPYSNWSLLIDQPFAPLVQSYQKCRNSPTTVMVNQIGIQIGNLSVLTPFCVLFVMALVYAYQKATKVVIPRAYSKQEKDAALEALAISLLLARDRRAAHLQQEQRKQRKAQAKGSNLQKLLQEHQLATTGGGAASGNAANGGGSEERSQVLWSVIEALEQDAPLHGDLYRLKTEVTRQQRQARPRKYISWKALKASAKNRLRRQRKTTASSTATRDEEAAGARASAAGRDRDEEDRDSALLDDEDGEGADGEEDYEDDESRRSDRSASTTSSTTGGPWRSTTTSPAHHLWSWIQHQTQPLWRGTPARSSPTGAAAEDGFSGAHAVEMHRNPMRPSADVEMATSEGASSSRSMSTVSTASSARTAPPIVVVEHFHMSDATRRLHVAKALQILNQQAPASAVSHWTVADMAVAAELLVRRLETLLRSMEGGCSAETEQQYWALLREISGAVREMRLSERARSLLSIVEDEASSSTTAAAATVAAGRMGVEEKAQLRSLVGPLCRLLALHGVGVTNLSLSQLSTLLGEDETRRTEATDRYASMWAYRLGGEVVVTLSELVRLRERLAIDSDDDDADDDDVDGKA